MTVEAMRARIGEVYDSDRWRRRVQLMPDNQVIAIYHTMRKHSLRNRGQFLPRNRKKPKVLYQQISMFD